MRPEKLALWDSSNKHVNTIFFSLRTTLAPVQHKHSFILLVCQIGFLKFSYKHPCLITVGEISSDQKSLVLWNPRKRNQQQQQQKKQIRKITSSFGLFLHLKWTQVGSHLWLVEIKRTDWWSHKHTVQLTWTCMYCSWPLGRNQST